MACGGYALRYLALVVREDEVHAAAVYVEGRTEVFGAHGGALGMPAGEAVAPGRGPPHDVLRRGFFPQGEVAGEAFLLLAVKFAGGGEHLLDDAAAELSVFVGLLLVFAHVEVHRAVADVGVAGVEYLLHEGYLLHDVAAGVGLYARGQHAEALHGGVVAVGVVLRHLHGLQLLQARLLGYLVLALVGVVLQVAHVGDVAHVAHLVAQMLQVAEDDVEGDGGAGVAQVGVAVDRRAADVHAHMALVNRAEELFLMAQCIVYQQLLFHDAMSIELQRYAKKMNCRFFFIMFARKVRRSPNASSTAPLRHFFSSSSVVFQCSTEEVSLKYR